jgi:hypothetical protein
MTLVDKVNAMIFNAKLTFDLWENTLFTNRIP